MGKLDRYVKVEDSGLLHSTLSTLSNNCADITNQTKELKNLEREKHRIFIESKHISKELLFYLEDLNRHLVKQPEKEIKVYSTKKIKSKKKIKSIKKGKKRPKPSKGIARLKSNLDDIRASLK